MLNRPSTPKNSQNTRDDDPIRLRVVEEKTWQDRLMGSPVLLISILVHVVVIGAGILFYRQYEKLAQQAALAAQKNAPPPSYVEYPIQMPHQKKIMPSPDENTEPLNELPAPIPPITYKPQIPENGPPSSVKK